MAWFRKSAHAPETKSELTDPTSPSWAALCDMFASSASGVAVTAESAMRCAPVNAAVSIIADAVRTLPCKLYRTTNGDKEVDTGHAAYSLVHNSANDWQSAGQLRALVTTDALLHGDGHAFVGKAGGKPSELIYLPRGSVVTEWDNIGRPSYTVDNKTYSVDEILHVQSPISLDGKRGLGLLQAGRDAIGLSILLERSAASLFKNNSRPGGVISVKGGLKPDAAGRLAQAWKAAHGGDKSGGVAVIDNEGKYEPVAFTSVDSQQAEQRAFAVSEISRLTRVPVTMLSDLSRATWSNTEQLQLQFLQVCMLPWLRAWTDAYARVLLSRDERASYNFEFVTDDLLRADTAARAEAYSKLRAAGVVTANEVRRLENLPPIEGGDVLQNPFTTSGKAPANDNQPQKDEAA